MPGRKIRRRITGPLTTEQQRHFRQASQEVEAQESPIKARGKALLKQLQAVDLPQIIAALRASRLSRGLSATDVAGRLNMDAGNYSRLESGQTNPTLATLSRMADAIGVKVRIEVK
ncbi:MAG: helix-turn-helix transcriptional regulator [Planctomycetaceae bacterium]|nr:helix-turn-helix transcriptional regulator [Planctomycetaceae bacterium]